MKKFRYKERLKKIEEFHIKYNIGELTSKINNLTLDRDLKYIFNELNWLEELKYIPKGEKHQRAIEGLSSVRNNIEDALVSHLSRNNSFKDEYLSFDPQLIILPIANFQREFSDYHMEEFSLICSEYPSCNILLTCKGRNPEDIGISQIKDHLIDKWNITPERIYMEVDSIDILGSAVLTKLFIKKEMSHIGVRDILILGSPYQFTSLTSYFKRVYGPGYRIRVVCHKKNYLDLPLKNFPTEKVFFEEIRELVRNEFRLLYRNNSLLDMESILPGNEKEFFYKMIIYHDLYKSDFRLLRKYNLLLSI